MESSLSLSRADYKVRVAINLGWGRGASFDDRAWTSLQDSQLNEFVSSGLRNFYFPALEGGAAYEWSFMRPVATLPFPQAADTIDLPDDFGGLEGQGSLAGSTTTQSWPIQVVGIGAILKLFVDCPTITGQPTMAAVVPVKGTTPVASTRFQLKLYPIADQDYTINFQYYVLPEALTDAFPYALGGAAHVETILESCLAISEQRLDDMVGVHTMKFKERLSASMAYDRRLKAQHFGYNADNSEGRFNWSRSDLYNRYGQNYVTFDGVVPG